MDISYVLRRGILRPCLYVANYHELPLRTIDDDYYDQDAYKRGLNHRKYLSTFADRVIDHRLLSLSY